jgi:hypothetical protein
LPTTRRVMAIGDSNHKKNITVCKNRKLSPKKKTYLSEDYNYNKLTYSQFFFKFQILREFYSENNNVSHVGKVVPSARKI